MTFSRIVSEWADNSPIRSRKGDVEVISIGDAQHERQALLQVNEDHDVKFVPKSLKLLERPTVEELKEQHDVMLANLGFLLKCESSLDMMYQNGAFVEYPTVRVLERPRTSPLQFSSRKRFRYDSPPRVSHSRGH